MITVLDGERQEVRSKRHPHSSVGPPNGITSPPCDFNLGALRREALGGGGGWRPGWIRRVGGRDEAEVHALKGIKDSEEGEVTPT